MSELEKWADAQPEMAAILDFMDWCEKQKIELAVPREYGNWLRPVFESRTDLLNRYFKINARKLEQERSALLTRERSGDVEQHK